ncbi:MAG: hypothetical protein A2542_00925 [Parcubacteria group bacterium RIFOXYD2_FULL_52_8]|nr:MAG: hypothetical protein A2542_00925 [Parcubacteria group bacterium RIFOXYD2_FULL_52_8]
MTADVPKPTIEHGEEFWLTYMRSYHRIFSELPPYQRMVDVAASALAKTDNILDSAAGSGVLAKRLLQAGKHVTVLDKYEGVLELLRTHIHGHGDRSIVAQADANEPLPFASEQFGGVASLLALPFMDNPDMYLDEHIRVLQSGGTMVVSGPSTDVRKVTITASRWFMELRNAGVTERQDFDADWEVLLTSIAKTLAEGKIFHWFTVAEVEEMLMKKGMAIVQSTPNPLYYGYGYLVEARKQ